VRVAVDLRSDYPFWCFGPAHERTLTTRFPSLDFRIAAGDGEVPDLVAEAEVFFGWRFVPSWFVRARCLRWIASPAAGWDHLPVAEAQSRRVAVTRSYGFHGLPMAEHVMGLVFGFARGLFLSGERQRSHRWWKDEVADTFFDVAGATMTIVGCGSVGASVAQLAHAAGMRVLGVRRHQPTDLDHGEHVEWVELEHVDRALAASRVVVNLLPATPSTERFFGPARFAAMRRGAVFINVGRGSTVDEAALLSALDGGRLSWCGLDVTAVKPPPMDSRLRQHPRVVLTPKTAVFTARYMDRAVAFFADNLARYLAGQPLLGLVTQPLELAVRAGEGKR
jgi:phosphoglycerate dehydrogenase-like enzyme